MVKTTKQWNRVNINNNNVKMVKETTATWKHQPPKKIHSFNRNLKNIYVFSKELQTLNCYKHFSIYTLFILLSLIYFCFFLLFFIYNILYFRLYSVHLLYSHFSLFQEKQIHSFVSFFVTFLLRENPTTRRRCFSTLCVCSCLFVIFIRLNTTMRHDRSLETELN